MTDNESTDAAVVDAEVVPDERALVPSTQAPATLFRTDDPSEVIARASAVADALKAVLDKQGLTANISGKRHVLVEGWTTLGAMVGVTAVPVWTRPLDGKAPEGKSFGYEARVEARTLDGRVIGAAEAMCTRTEGRWKGADDYALRSMAQTRATSKALRGPLGFVVTLAGYESTPAEEMPHDEQPRVAARASVPKATATKQAPTEEGASQAQRRKMFAKANEAGLDAKAFKALLKQTVPEAGGHTDRVPKSKVTAVLAAIAEAAS